MMHLKIHLPTLIFINLLALMPVRFFAQTFLPSKIVYNDTGVIHAKRLFYSLQHDQLLELPFVQELDIELCEMEVDTVYYQLSGYEQDWNWTLYPSFRYTNLPGGTYTLWIGESPSPDGAPLAIQFRTENRPGVSDAWWIPPLLTVCLMLIPFTLVFFYFLNRSRRSLDVEMIRNQIASDLHDDVGANLGAINNLTELLMQPRTQSATGMQSKLVGRIKQYTELTLRNLQDTVWAINPFNDSVEQLLDKLVDFAGMMLHAKGIEMHLENNYRTELSITLDMQQRHSLFLMFKEMVHNIIKHSEATEARISITNSRHELQIEIHDNGKGFDTGTPYAGNGLRNLQERATRNFIEFTLESELGKGAQARMLVKSLG